MYSELIKRIFTSVLLLFTIYLSINNNYIFFIFLFICFSVILFEFYSIYMKIFSKNLSNLFISMFTTCLILTCLITYIFLFNLNKNNLLTLIGLILICILTDIGGYVFGKIFKGKKLTSISPNKTYSGMIGSFLFPIIFITFFYQNLSDFYFSIFFILIISLISQVGDLFISLLKRKAKLKHTGIILPGHGGLLDRVDGMIFAIPFGIFIINTLY